jgi:shikimate kinase/3-dehydroquinate synthase
MMGSGKSTIGRILSSVLDKEFIDMDSEIERRTGKTISSIFDEEGESAFRKLEKSLLKELVSKDNIIVSTGGGIILDEQNRRILRAESTIYLKLPPADLFKRVDVSNRPLLKNGKDRIYRIWEERRGLYEQFPSVETSGMSQWETVASICMRILSGDKERLDIKNHPVTISPGSFKRVGGMQNIVVSRRVHKIFSEWIPSSALSIEDGEEAKGFHTLFEVYDFLMERGLSRNDMLVAAGGGTITDLVGFGASTFKRGIPLTLYPTTLLSQVDASIGGKNGINFRGCKNMIGNFYFPAETVLDPVVTLSMDEGRFEEGLVEAFKIFLISGNWYEQFKEKRRSLKERNLSSLSEMLEEAVKQKDRIVAMDTNERGIRKILNLGHTLGHLYEPIAGVSHGMAIAWGLEREMYYFMNLGIIDEVVYRDVTEVLSEIFDLDLPPLPLEEALQLLKNDKKGLPLEERGIEVPVVKSPGIFEMITVKLDDLLAVVA